MRWFIAGLSVVACLMPWRAAFAQSGQDAVTRDVLNARVSGAALQKMCYNPRAYVVEAQGQILGYGTDKRISPAQIETAIDAALARLRVQEMRWLLEADLNFDLAISARERDVLVHAASVLMQDRLKQVHRLADDDGNDVVSLAELQRYAAGKAEETLSDDIRRGMRTLMAFDLDNDGWIALSEVSRAVEVLCETA